MRSIIKTMEILKKRSIGLNADKQKETRNLELKRKLQNKELARLKKLVQRQADKLKAKNEQFKKVIKKQVRSEEQIHIRTKAMESAADGIFIIDARTPIFPIIYANQAFQKLTGCLKSEILGRDYFLFYGPDVDHCFVDRIMQTILEGKSFCRELFSFQKGGKKNWNLLSIAPVRDSSGSVTHYVGIQTDVTLAREKELEADEQREVLLHVTRVGKLAEFVSSLAHEISQPLTAILSYAQAAQRMLADREPKFREILQYIINDDQRASEVIQRLRSLLKKSKSEKKLLNINVLIGETIVLIAADATIRNSVIKTEFDDSLPFICGDRIQLQQVILNLISNSFDALENSKLAREILICTSFLKGLDSIMVEVIDSGCGIPAGDMPKLFTRFFTSKPDGLGMGLSISRSIVEAHGGRMDVKNNPDRGVTFYFTLPIDKKDV